MRGCLTGALQDGKEGEKVYQNASYDYLSSSKDHKNFIRNSFISDNI